MRHAWNCCVLLFGKLRYRWRPLVLDRVIVVCVFQQVTLLHRQHKFQFLCVWLHRAHQVHSSFATKRHEHTAYCLVRTEVVALSKRVHQFLRLPRHKGQEPCRSAKGHNAMAELTFASTTWMHPAYPKPRLHCTFSSCGLGNYTIKTKNNDKNK
jgi:hypothetical protein